jgi:chromosome segregation ATPase
MLDAFKKASPTKEQIGELQALLAASREERAALSAMLTQVQLQSAKLASAVKSQALQARDAAAMPAGAAPAPVDLDDALRQVRSQIAALHERMDHLTSALTALAERTPPKKPDAVKAGGRPRGKGATARRGS